MAYMEGNALVQFIIEVNARIAGTMMKMMITLPQRSRDRFGGDNSGENLVVAMMII